ncbi:hypothetical protein IU449_26805 [Nocardia higoensis]|uniref:Uncharacterized protein n=1 Tax=Nocardia higoensis TaxID=228599 RepID=A0ABS0DI21_9NOCA|nr:hypothetical protein [Nocardia higoensis]MBF6358110.1 hypothetical protein [Nocardia higoensis]
MTYIIRTDGSESTGPEGIYLVWGRNHWEDRKIEARDSLDDALHCYEKWEHSGYGDPGCIEGPAGLVPWREVDAWVKAARVRAEQAAAQNRRDGVGQVCFTVELRAPDSDEAAEFARADDLSDAIEILGRLNKPGRVRIVMRVLEWNGWRTERVIHDWAPANEQQEAA